ncbi:hypothetical protein [Anaerovibrio sp.]|uniref:hypothetical protein n=1 Tax=Anaerovibrio sp. TaxID=1872532 RepID=UPI0025C6B1F9|nr:hypothetical protein [Anaerovibrio sp.]MBR2141982.1 hypothetical protein [Anaerovibrio sp.]
MSEQDFIDMMVELMDTEDEITIDSVLDELEDWDSLSYVVFLARCSKDAKSHIEPQEVRDAKTIRDLFDLMNRQA